MANDNKAKDKEKVQKIKEQLDKLGVQYPEKVTAIQLVEILSTELNKRQEQIESNNNAPLPKGRNQDFSVADKPEDSTKIMHELTQQMNKEKQAMKDFLAGQEKVKFFIPLGIGEVAGKAYETWMRNGYGVKIMKGVYADLPLAIAEDLVVHLQITTEALGTKMMANRDEAHQKALSS